MLDEREPTRLQLEKAIEDKASEIDFAKPGVAWLDDPEWEAFREAQYELLRYYQGKYPVHGDTVIGPLGLAGFTDFLRLLRKALLSGELNESQRERAEEELLSLENWMDEVIRETMTNLRFHHPELGV